MKIKFLFSSLFVGLIGLWGLVTVNAEYSQELRDAYKWARSVSVTTQSSIDTANMQGEITRAQMAKMISNYAKNILNKTADESAKCEFNDISSVKGDLAEAIVNACRLGIMGQGISDFRPNDSVTRAEFGTVLSRTLWGNKNEGGSLYYENHLKALQAEGIMNNNSSPMNKELRGYVMLMLMRASGDKAENNEQIITEEETVVSENNQNEVEKIESKTLVVYFSRADENYSVGIVEKGNTALLAEYIANYLKADTFEIIPVISYPIKYSEVIDVAKKEQNDNARPEYKGDVINWSDYDTILLGYPIWWGDLPMVVYTFIENHNFDGKTVYLFNTHEGYGNAGTFAKLKEKLSKAKVDTDGLTVRGSGVRKDDIKNTVETWLTGKNLSEIKKEITFESKELHVKYSNGDDIYGVVYVPQDGKAKHPTIIMSHGLGGTADSMKRYAETIVKEGYVTYIYDFRGGGEKSRSSLKTTDMSPLTEIEDLKFVLSTAKSWNYVDTSKIYLMGCSQGGLVSALTAPDVSEDIVGIIAFYPAFTVVDMVHKNYKSLDEVPDSLGFYWGTLGKKYFEDLWDYDAYAQAGKYTGKVLLLQGDADAVVDISYVEKYKNSLKNVEYHVISGAGHSFTDTNEHYLEAVGYLKNFLLK